MSTFKANAFLLTNLLDGIEKGDIQLPDFQRGWVWDDARIEGSRPVKWCKSASSC